jgi:hypothetical protein
MKHNFKPGDRVRVYGHESFVDGGVAIVIESELESGRIGLRTETCRFVFAHPKQLRRLKPRAKLREWELSFFVDSSGIEVVSGPDLKVKERVRVREVRRKSK